MLNITWSSFMLAEFIASHEGSFDNIYCLDIGSGAGEQAAVLRKVGINVDTMDKYENTSEIQDDFMEHSFTKRYNVILCSHVIEHQRNVGLFLDKLYDVLTDNGLLLLSAPKHPADRLIEGHLSSFRTACFIQNILYSGFDMKRGKYLSCGGIENSAILPKREFSDRERGHAGYKWTQEQQERTIVELKQGANIDNDIFFFHNCKLFQAGQVFKQGSVITSSGGLVRKDLTFTADRWGISFVL